MPKAKKPVIFRTAGDERLCCRMLLTGTGKNKLRVFIVTVNGNKDALKGKQAKNGCIEYRLPRNADIKIDWNRNKK